MRKLANRDHELLSIFLDTFAGDPDTNLYRILVNGATREADFGIKGVNAYLDDNYIHLHGRRTINEVNLLWRDWFDGLYADGATTGRMMVLHLHPWIMGQPWRIRHLDEVLGHICAHQGVWKATGGEIIDWFKELAT